MRIFDAMEVIAGGLSAERVRLNVTASNLANANTTRTVEGGPYKRRDPIFVAQPLTDEFGENIHSALTTVDVPEIAEDTKAARKVYDPSHPDADPNGYVQYPNINMVEEMVNMITATRGYEAGITAMKSLVEMAQKALTIGR